MFWNLGLNVSKIDQLFEKDEKPTLEQILNEQEIIQELKGQNNQLINFLTEDCHIKQIIDYIAESETNKFSKVCLDILTANVQPIEETLFDQPILLKCLWNIVHSTDSDPSPLTRIMMLFAHLATVKSNELYNFLTENNINFVEDIMNHLELIPACELLLRMLTNKMDECVSHYQNKFLEKNFTKKLIETLACNNLPEKSTGATFVISELVRTIRTDTSPDEPTNFEISFMEALFKYIIIIHSDELLDILVKTVVEPSNPTSKFSAASILSMLFNLQRCGHFNGDEFFVPGNIPIRFIKLSKTDFSKFGKHIESLVNVIKPTDSDSPSFGRLRLLVLELIVSLILYNDDSLAIELARLNVANTLMNLFESYPENNFVHSLVQLALTSILNASCWKTKASSCSYTNPSLVNSLFQSDNFIKKLLHLTVKKASYTGHIHEIHRSLVKVSTTDSPHKKIITERLESLSPELLTSLKATHEHLADIDKHEAIDQQFLHAVTDELEVSDGFANDNTSFIPINKSFDFFKLEKAQFEIDDSIDKFESHLQLSINMSSASDPFTEVSIQDKPLPFHRDADVSETLDNLLNPDHFSTNSNPSSPQDDESSSCSTYKNDFQHHEFTNNIVTSEVEDMIVHHPISNRQPISSLGSISPPSPDHPAPFLNDAFENNEEEDSNLQTS